MMVANRVSDGVHGWRLSVGICGGEHGSRCLTTPRCSYFRLVGVALRAGNQNEETFSTLTNMPWPVLSFVKRVPSPVGQIVQPLML